MSITINSTFALDNRLTTRTNVKQEINISSTTNDAFIDNLVLRASDAVESYTGRKFQKLDITETLQSQGQPLLVLSHRPVQSITQIKFDGSTISSTTYEIDDKNAGILFRKSSWTNTLMRSHFIENIPRFIGERDWSVRYVYGFDLPNSTLYSASTAKLPNDVEHATIQAIKAWYLERDRNPRLRMQRIGDAQESLFAPENVDSFALPPISLALLSRWRELDI